MPYVFNEIRYRGGASSDFFEVAIPSNADPSEVVVYQYNQFGFVEAQYNLGDYTSFATENGHDYYYIPCTTGLSFAEGLALAVDGQPVSFYSWNNLPITANNGPFAGTQSTVLDLAPGTTSFQRQDDGSFQSSSSTPGSGPLSYVPCFLRGTPIRIKGKKHKKIENLVEGDLVKTKFHQFQPLRFVAKTTIRPHNDGYVKNLPILIPAHALAPNCPSVDIYVSPNHRILLRHEFFKSDFNTKNLLVPARYMIGYNGIGKVLPDDQNIRYFHLIFDNHEVVETKGLYSESFFIGDHSVKRLREMDKKQLNKLLLKEQGIEGYLVHTPAAELADGQVAKEAAFRYFNFPDHIA